MDTDPQARTQYEIIAGDGEIYGPYSLEDLQQYLDEERVQWDTQVRVPGTDDWMPIIRLISPPEFETTAATTTENEPSVDGGSADINVMDALKKGWGILQKNMGVAIGVFIVGGLLLSISGCLVIPPLLLAGPMVGGLCIFSLKATRGEYVEFGDLFKGFSNFGGFLAAFICVALDSHRFWIFPFGVLDKFTVKVYDNSPKYREYENAWGLLEKLNQSGLFLVHL